MDYMSRSVEALNAMGEKRILLTVSPVPMEATFTGQNAIMANSYSKAVLRVLAEEIQLRFSNVDYYPSYEMVSSVGCNALEFDNVHVKDSVVEQITQHMIDGYTYSTATGTEEDAALSLYNTLWMTLYELNDIQGALQLARELNLKHPSSWLGHDALGHCYSKAGDHAAAIEAANMALRLLPNHWGLTLRLGYVHLAAGHLDEARRVFREAVRLGAPQDSLPEH
jgi:tetratricopeptide (TPR) repeat protein